MVEPYRERASCSAVGGRPGYLYTREIESGRKVQINSIRAVDKDNPIEGKIIVGIQRFSDHDPIESWSGPIDANSVRSIDSKFVLEEHERLYALFENPSRGDELLLQAFGEYIDEESSKAIDHPIKRNKATEIHLEPDTSVQGKSLKVFICYAHEDADSARRLCNDLKSAGVNVWLDKKSILGGQRWKNTIRSAIKDSRYFLAILSSNSVIKRGYVQKELSMALEILDEFPESSVFIIPVRLDECEPSHEKLCELHWVDMFPDWNRGLKNILASIKLRDNSDKQSHGPDSKSPISRDSFSWVSDNDPLEQSEVTIITQEGDAIDLIAPAFIDVAPIVDTNDQGRFKISEYRRYRDLMLERRDVSPIRKHARDNIYELLKARKYSSSEIEAVVDDILGWLEKPPGLTEDDILTALLIFCQRRCKTVQLWRYKIIQFYINLLAEPILPLSQPE